jgi:hypothetical protein
MALPWVALMRGCPALRQLRIAGLGRAVQVDPIEPTLKAPRTKRFKLTYDEPPSNFAFKFNSRRYSWVARRAGGASHKLPSRSFTLSVSVPGNAYLLEIEGLLTQGSRPGWTVGESVGGNFKMDSSDWSNGIRYHVFDTTSDTEFNSRTEGPKCVALRGKKYLSGPTGWTPHPAPGSAGDPWSAPPGEAVQLDPIKPLLKAPGAKRLKLNFEEPLSNFAFKFNLRRYTPGPPGRSITRRRWRRGSRRPRWAAACTARRWS